MSADDCWLSQGREVTVAGYTIHGGMLYVGQEIERSSSSARTSEVGALMKIDPTNPDDPLVWSVADPDGIWATPGISDGVVVAPTDSGRIVGGVWVQGDCDGNLHGFDFSDPRTEPPELWSVQLEGCVESTPAVWDGQPMLMYSRSRARAQAEAG